MMNLEEATHQSPEAQLAPKSGENKEMQKENGGEQLKMSRSSMQLSESEANLKAHTK